MNFPLVFKSLMLFMSVFILGIQADSYEFVEEGIKQLERSIEINENIIQSKNEEICRALQSSGSIPGMSDTALSERSVNSTTHLRASEALLITSALLKTASPLGQYVSYYKLYSNQKPLYVAYGWPVAGMIARTLYVLHLVMDYMNDRQAQVILWNAIPSTIVAILDVGLAIELTVFLCRAVYLRRINYKVIN